jgi:mono/diheme cytochrome c family protein
MSRKNSSMLLGAGASYLLLALLPILALLPMATFVAADPTSVWQGVYTKQQAERGRATYFSACASCHGVMLQGDSDIPELVGNSFVKRWSGVSIGAFVTFTSSQMPIGRPGSLGAQGYVEVVAYILQTNGFPEGQQELPIRGTALDMIIMDARK